MGEADDLLEMAHEELAQLPLMAEAGVVERKRWSSIYYAMFYVAEAALLVFDFEPRTHTGVNTLVGKELYREQHLVDKELASFYSEMRRLREDLDYNPYAVLPERSLESATDLAETFIGTMAAIVDREYSDGRSGCEHPSNAHVRSSDGRAMTEINYPGIRANYPDDKLARIINRAATRDDDFEAAAVFLKELPDSRVRGWKQADSVDDGL